MNAPDLTEPISGFRAWNLDAKDNLRSVYVGSQTSRNFGFYPWESRPDSEAGLWWPGPNLAHCFFTIERHPRDECPGCAQCGFYAFHDLDSVHSCYGVVGAIRAWGNVEVHRQGFRAQHAEVVALLKRSPMIRGPSRDRIETVAHRYGVPAVSRPRRLEKLARRRGSPVPASLYP